MKEESSEVEHVEIDEMKDPKRFISRMNYNSEFLKTREEFEMIVRGTLERVIYDMTGKEEEEYKRLGLDIDIEKDKERGFEFIIRCKPMKEMEENFGEKKTN